MRDDPILPGGSAAAGDGFIPCHVKQLHPDLHVAAAEEAVRRNPQNAVTVAAADLRALASVLPPERIAVLTKKYWPAGQVITVGFLEDVPAALMQKIVDTANDWNRRGANILFTLTPINPMIRVTLRGDGYWSYLGTDILSIPADQPTLCLQDFSLDTPQGEYNRVVKHEFSHSLGAPHEHMRRDIVARLDSAKTIAYFRMTQGWDERTVRDQVLTPLDEASLMGTPVDVDSIMSYALPGSITRDGRPIPGGSDIDASDAAFMARVYPGLVVPPTPPTPPAPKPAPGSRVHGYIGITGSKAVRKLVAYFPDGKGGEIGYQHDGPFAFSRDNPDVLMFDGPGKRL